MLWCKPAAALANPTETIPMNKFCASSLPDYEASIPISVQNNLQYIRHRYHAVSDLWQGELVFVTSRECRDLSPEQAESYILGYTIGNDISCRLHQLPEKGGGQYFFAKGFDKFAPIGPVLVSQKEFRKAQEIKLITKLNGEVMQEVECFRDFIWTPAQILSHMSQGQWDNGYSLEVEEKQKLFISIEPLTGLCAIRNNYPGRYSSYDGNTNRSWRVPKASPISKE